MTVVPRRPAVSRLAIAADQDLRVTREQLEHNQIPVYFAAVAIAAAAGLLAPTAAARADELISPSIALLMYAMFLQIPFLQLRQAFGKPRFITALLLANFVLLPVLVWVGTRGLVEQPALLIGALLVLLTPCIDYVVVFTHIGKGDARLTLAATPLLLLAQLALLPLYLSWMLAGDAQVDFALAPFIEAFVWMIVAPLLLALLTSAGTRHSRALRVWNDAWTWLPVPAMALVLMVVIGSQIAALLRDLPSLLPVIPVYLGFMLLAPLVGYAAARLFKLPVSETRSVMFSAATRNSLVVLPLALALPEPLRGLAAAAIITQTLLELLGELLYVRLIPALIRQR